MTSLLGKSSLIESLLVESMLRSLLMAAMVWLGLKLFRVSHVLAQKIAWGVVLLVAFAMPFLMRWQQAHPKMALAVPVRQVPAVAALEKTVIALEAVPEKQETVPEKQPDAVISPASTAALPIVSMQPGAAPASAWRLSDLVRFIVPAYLFVCAALLLRLLIGLAMAMRIWRRAEPASPILEPRAEVRISSMIQSPVTIGSAIILPANYTEWDRAKLRLVLAHERSHVHQGDFYLQLFASLYAALVWFSPLGWWLKRRLADLGEAISDRAALEEADDHPSYAALLLEFAAMPRYGFARMTAGVGMARSSNIQRRIDRILNDRIFQRAFSSGRRHALIAALLVPCGLVVATSLLHVRAAEAVKATAIAVLQDAPASAPAAQPEPAPRPEPAAHPAQVAPVTSAPTAIETVVSAPVTIAPIAPMAVAIAPKKVQLSPLEIVAKIHTAVPVMLADDLQVSVSDSHDENGSFAIIDGRGHSVIVQGRNGIVLNSDGDELDHARAKVQGSFILFEHDGRPYVITDPDLIAKSKSFYGPGSELGHQEAELGRQEAELGRQQGLLGAQQAMMKIPTPDISKEMAQLQAEVNKLASEKAQEITQERLGEIQARVGELQGKLAEAQAVAGSKQAMLGSQQGDLGAKQAELGRKQAELGREQARISRQAAQQVQSLIDQAIKDGKARPLD
jgi:beta-lactamase regulating signal transducer with metallopeptidase domain